MSQAIIRDAEEIQRLAARLIATHPAGEHLRLIGGFRYRLLDDSVRRSIAIVYHWDGDAEGKQGEIITLLSGKLLPEVRSRFGLEGSVQGAVGPEADSPIVKTVVAAFFRTGVPGSRIEIPIEITSVPCDDPPVVRTAAGTVYLTLSDADMAESKVIALVSRLYLQERDLLDLFLFRDGLRDDSAERLAGKLSRLGRDPGTVGDRLERIASGRSRHVRALDRIIGEQVEESAAVNLRAAGGGAMVFDQVLEEVRKLLAPSAGGRS